MHLKRFEMNGYKFFLFGCLFTSLTWSLSLYMYWKLNTKPEHYSQAKLFRRENTFDYVRKQKSKYFKNHVDKNGWCIFTKFVLFKLPSIELYCT